MTSEFPPGSRLIYPELRCFDNVRQDKQQDTFTRNRIDTVLFECSLFYVFLLVLILLVLEAVVIDTIVLMCYLLSIIFFSFSMLYI